MLDLCKDRVSHRKNKARMRPKRQRRGVATSVAQTASVLSRTKISPAVREYQINVDTMDPLCDPDPPGTIYSSSRPSFRRA